MKRSPTNLWLLLLGVSVLALLVFVGSPSTRQSVSVALSGPSGAVVAGHWTIDGVRNDFQATLPTNFTTRARSLSFECIAQGDPGVFGVRLVPERTDLGPLVAESDYGIRGHLRFEQAREDRSLVSFPRSPGRPGWASR